MSNFLLQFVGWLSLAYVAVKIVTAYYLFMFAPSRLAAALAKLLALSPWDAVILLFAAAALAWAARAAELTTWAKAAFGPVAVSTGLEEVADSVRKAGAPQQAIDGLRADLRNFAVRSFRPLSRSLIAFLSAWAMLSAAAAQSWTCVWSGTSCGSSSVPSRRVLRWSMSLYRVS